MDAERWHFSVVEGMVQIWEGWRWQRRPPQIPCSLPMPESPINVPLSQGHFLSAQIQQWMNSVGLPIIFNVCIILGALLHIPVLLVT